MKSKITPIVLCGGSGTRLWPLSNASRPKQFIPLLNGGKSLLQLTLERVALFKSDVICIGADRHANEIADTLVYSGVKGQIILEPYARNTAAALTLCALHVSQTIHPEALILCCPADHHIPDDAAFFSMVQGSVNAALSGSIVIYGVTPTFPSTAYGYIQRGQSIGDSSAHKVARFVEKPQLNKAIEMCESDKYLWNSGICLLTAKTLISSMQMHARNILLSCEAAMLTAAVDESFVKPSAQSMFDCQALSIDYAVLEHHHDVVVFPFNHAWSDVGNWNSVAQLYAPNIQGNRSAGHALTIDSENLFIHAPHKTVATLGVNNLIIVDTPEALLVANRDCIEHIRDVVSAYEASEEDQIKFSAESIKHTDKSLQRSTAHRTNVKHFKVLPHTQLPIAKQDSNLLHWVVTSGNAFITKADESLTLATNESIYIPAGIAHQLENRSDSVLEIIEIQIQIQIQTQV